MISPARVVAYDILFAVSAGRLTLSTAIARSRASLQDDRDRALAAEIATGVQRWRAAIDHLIAHFSARQPSRIDAEVLEILRLSIYQLVYLARVPPAAVVDDAVELARRVGKSSASGFVNAVLRATSRNRARPPWPPPPEADGDRKVALDYLSTTLSHPDWLAERWYDRFGFERAEEWLRFNNVHAPLTLRANRLLITPEALRVRLRDIGITASPGGFAPDALVVEAGQPLRHPALEGLFVVQDEASQLITLLAGAEPGHWVLDTCASPGGKATALAAAIGQGDRVVACDVRANRMALLGRTVSTARAQNVLLVQADLLNPLPFSRRFDCVIVDAPCSGLGTLRRDPDIRWRRREADLLPLAISERRMLRHAASVVERGGRLVYATCSSEPEENEDVAAAFLDESPNFHTMDACQAHPALVPALVDERGHLRTSPDRHSLEAFFGAVFTRSERA